MSSNFGHSNIACVIVSEPRPQQGHVALRVIDIRAAEDRSGWQLEPKLFEKIYGCQKIHELGSGSLSLFLYLNSLLVNPLLNE